MQENKIGGKKWLLRTWGIHHEFPEMSSFSADVSDYQVKIHQFSTSDLPTSNSISIFTLILFHFIKVQLIYIVILIFAAQQ